MIRDKKLLDAIDEYGRVVLSTDDIIESMLSGHDSEGVTLREGDDLDQYRSSCKEFAVEPMRFDEYYKLEQSPDVVLHQRSKDWLIPKKYRNIDIVDYLSARCKNDEEKQRLILELNEFVERGQEMIIYLMIYLVDVMREHNVVWGVGRGSSVACFVLYLIGINKVNPLDYDIDYREFFKEE